MLNIKPNQVVRVGTLIGVVEGADIYRPNCFNIYMGDKTTKRLFPKSDISEIIDESYVDKPMFAFQVYKLIK